MVKLGELSRGKCAFSRVITFRMCDSNSLSSSMFQSEDEKLRSFRAKEKIEVEKNKWYLSEKAGRDVGYDFAEWDFYVRFRRKWLDGLRASGQYPYD